MSIHTNSEEIRMMPPLSVLPMNKQRIFGFETEYGLGSMQAIHEPRAFHDSSQYTYALPRANNLMLTNMMLVDALPSQLAYQPRAYGFTTIGRFYSDVGQLEYSSPELLTVKGLLASYFANERHVARAVERIFGEDAYPIKRSLDSAYNTRGDHENYLVGTNMTLKTAEMLAGHLAVRTVLTGPGAVLPVRAEQSSQKPEGASNPGFYFAYDQRNLTSALIFDNGYGSKVTRGLMKNSLDAERILERTLSQRLQIVSGSHNIFPYPVAARFFNTSSVLRLIEHRRYPKSLIVDDPIGAARQTALEGANATIELLDGRTSTPAHIEYELMSACLKLDLPPEERQMAELSANIAADIAAGLGSYWSDHVEWIAKRDFLQQQADKRDVALTSVEMAALDIRWHILGRHGLVDRMRSAMPIALMPAEKDMQRAMYLPPDPTRAQLRAEALRCHAKRSVPLTGINWAFWASEEERIHVPDPYRTSYQEDKITSE